MRLILLFLGCIILTELGSQIPPAAFNYSAVARDAQGDPISEKQISIQVLIRSGTIMGPIEFEEIHEVTTDAFGLFTLVIGIGMNQSGDLSQIEWASNQYFMQIGIDPDGGQQFTLSNATQLLSVPYAMHAKTAESVLTPEYQTLSISNDTLYLTNGGFAKLPPSVLTPSNLIQPEVSDITISNIGSNTATFQFRADNINDYEITISTLLYSKNSDIFVQSSGINDLSRKAGDIEISNNPFLSSLAASTTYYVWARIGTINGLSFFSQRNSFTTPSIGHEGPAGGIVFFDKGYVSDGWRYMEIYPTTPDTLLPWGCEGTAITGLADSLGLGLTDTEMIVQQCNDPQTAAKFCQEFSSGGYNDWFLPLPTELMLALINLQPLGIGDFAEPHIYWTSRQTGANGGVTVNVSEQSTDGSLKSTLHQVRPIRRY
jgi:hypothetical protein